MSTKCTVCGKEFTPRAHNKGLYCSHACSGAARRKGIEIACANCGKSFIVPPSLNWPNRCCSQKCSLEFSRKKSNGRPEKYLDGSARTKRICEYCKKDFEPLTSEVNRGGGRYCSHVCSERAASKRILKQCEICGSDFYTLPCLIERGGGKYCGNDCKHIARGGENSVFYVHGLARDPNVTYAGKFNIAFKKSIRERDAYTCAVCGKWGNTVHHIDYDKAHTTPENCITLCKKCHSKTSLNRNIWQAHFEGLMAERK